MYYSAGNGDIKYNGTPQGFFPFAASLFEKTQTDMEELEIFHLEFKKFFIVILDVLY